MLTGLVYLAVVVLWAVVLVPQWLRRHDRNAEHRTTLTFHRAMRTLERRRLSRGVSRASHDTDVIVAGARSKVHDRVSLDHGDESPIDMHLDHGIDPFIGGVEEDELRDTRKLRSQVKARETAARRRRQVQQVLIGLSVISVVALFMGWISFLLAMLAPIALAAFWWLSRQQDTAAKLSEERRARRSAARAATNSANNSATQRTAKRSSRSSSSRRRNASEPAATSDTAEIRMLSTDEARANRNRSAAATKRSWDAVDAPIGRTVSRSQRPDDWTSERMLEQAEALRNPNHDVDSELGLDDFVDVPGAREDVARYRRAVNE